MTDQPMTMPTWSRRRWCLSIALVLAFQGGLVFLLEGHSPGMRRNIVSVPVIHLRNDISLEQFAVSDPTAFVFPHRNGFSGEAWLNHLLFLDFQPADWTEPPRVLSFAPENLGGNFKEFITANSASQFEAIPTIEPMRSVPSLYPVETMPEKSILRIEGPLAQRRMLMTPQLPVWQSADLVTNSVVELRVDAQGRTISAVVLAPGVRLGKQIEADLKALEMAKTAEFEPSPEALMFGTMIFEWQMLPMLSTNGPAEIP